MTEHHRNIFDEIDPCCHPYPADEQEQTYRLGLDFTVLEAQMLLCADLAHDVENLDDYDRELLGGLATLIEELFAQRIPNPGGPQ